MIDKLIIALGIVLMVIGPPALISYLKDNPQVSHEQTYCYDKYQSGMYYPCRDIHEYEGEA